MPKKSINKQKINKQKEDGEKPDKLKIFYIAILLFIPFLLYCNTLPGKFLNWDDDKLITKNIYIQKGLSWNTVKEVFTPGKQASYQPLRDLSYLIDFRLWGCEKPLPWHLHNIILYSIGGVFLFLFLIEILSLAFKKINHTERELLAFLITLVWLVHPIHSEAVAWISARKEVLSGLFFWVTFYFHLKNRFYLAFFFYLLALASKSSVIIFPVLAIFVDYLFNPQKQKRFFWVYIVYLGEVALLSLATMVTASSKGIIKSYFGGSLISAIFNMSAIFFRYLFILLLPVKLSIIYLIYDPENFLRPDRLVAFIGVILITALFIYLLKRPKYKWWCFILGWFLIGLLPVSNIIPLSTAMADRYLYLPSLAFALALITVLWQWQEGKKLFSWIIVILVAFYGWLTFDRNKVWLSDISLWQATAQYAPRSCDAHLNLGLSFFHSGNDEKALEEYKKAIKLSEPGDFQHYVAFYDMALVYFLEKDYNTAIKYLKYTLNEKPDYSKAHYFLAKCYYELGNYEEALKFALKIEQIKEADYFLYTENFYLLIGAIYQKLNKLDEAKGYYRKALDFNPKESAVYLNLGLLYLQEGKEKESKENFLTFLKMSPNAPQAENLRKFIKEKWGE